jgi:hypothetical protein
LPVEAEEIPGDDNVSRHFDSPYRVGLDGDLVWGKIFEFMRGEPESLVWRKYKPTIEEVHALGCERQVKIRERKPEWTYEGAATANVGQIRNVRTARGHGFVVKHEPGDGQGAHHAEISRESFVENRALEPADKTELLFVLERLFVDVDMHRCRN